MTDLNQPVAKPAVDADALLATLLSSFGKKPAAPKGVKKSLPKNASPLPQAVPQAFNLAKTGYTTWTPIAKIIMIEEQTCRTCGAVHKAVKDELFLLDHKTSHSSWLRHEGYGIEEPDQLEVRAEYLPPRVVSRCPTCISPSVEQAFELLFSPKQLSLPL